MFLHEEIHIAQKHSLDIFFVEILKALIWFNPFIYLYKKVIVTNHEFLADEKVIDKNNDVKSYQQLILSEILKQRNLDLTHQFNFNNTKKRFIMMTSKNSKFAQVKKYLCAPAFMALAILFAEKVYANDSTEPEKNNSVSVEIPKAEIKNNNGAYQEIAKIINKYDDIVKNKDSERFINEVPRDEQIKLAELFKQINAEDYQKLPLSVNYREINREIPTQKQLKQFLDSKYNIELDGKVVANNVLKHYKNSDFYSVYVVKVLPKNPDYGKYEYGVVLNTKDFAKKFNSQKNIGNSFKIKKEEYLEMIKKSKDTVKEEVKDVAIYQAQPDNKREVKESSQTVTVNQIDKNEYSVLPQYPGGINELRTKISKSFDGSKINSNNTKEMYRTDLTYTITEDGSVADIKAAGNNELFNTETIASFRRANENITWKPAEKDGKPARYRMRIPLTMSFE